MAIEFYKGFDSYVIYGAETSYGAGGSPSASNKVGKVQSININMTNNFFRTQGMGDGRNATVAVLGALDVSGSIEWQVDDFTFMQYAIGVIAGAGAVADPYELQEAANIGYDSGNIKTLALEIGSEGDSNDDVTTVTGVVLNTLTITATAGEVLTASCDFIGKTVATSTTLESYTAATTKPFVFQQGAVTVGTDTLQCTGFTWTLSNNIQTYRNLGDRTLAQPVMGVRRYDFSITVRKKYDSTASTLSATELRDYFFGASAAPATGGSVTAYAVSLDITEGAANGDRVVNIDLENCYFESWSEPIELEGGVIEVTVAGFGLAGLTDSSVKVPIRWYSIVA